MNIVFFSHPDFAGHHSMPRFTEMLAKGMEKRGHKIEIWMPQPKVLRLPLPQKFKKWAGYADQYLVFPKQVRRRMQNCSKNTLFVVTDHALGPWVPLVSNHAHVVHCHDFLAQSSALDEIAENPTGWTGKKYQAFIRQGYTKGKNFISVSEKTREDLHRFLSKQTVRSEVVYNGLNNFFEPSDSEKAKALLQKEIKLTLAAGYILHVGGNQWYKNRKGVIGIYEAWRAKSTVNIPLILIGEMPSSRLMEQKKQSAFEADIHFVTGISDKFVRLAYAGATLLLFPSLAEGFGWPIAEAMACGCPVVTTGEAPMTEVAGAAGFLIPRQPQDSDDLSNWEIAAATVVERIVQLTANERSEVVNKSLENAKRFNTDEALNKIENIYLEIIRQEATD